MARWSGWGGRTDFQTPNHKTKSSATPRKQGGYLKKICLKVGFKGSRGQKGGFPDFWGIRIWLSKKVPEVKILEFPKR